MNPYEVAAQEILKRHPGWKLCWPDDPGKCLICDHVRLLRATHLLGATDPGPLSDPPEPDSDPGIPGA